MNDTHNLKLLGQFYNYKDKLFYDSNNKLVSYKLVEKKYFNTATNFLNKKDNNFIINKIAYIESTFFMTPEEVINYSLKQTNSIITTKILKDYLKNNNKTLNYDNIIYFLDNVFEKNLLNKNYFEVETIYDLDILKKDELLSILKKFNFDFNINLYIKNRKLSYKDCHFFYEDIYKRSKKTEISKYNKDNDKDLIILSFLIKYKDNNFNNTIPKQLLNIENIEKLQDNILTNTLINEKMFLNINNDKYIDDLFLQILNNEKIIKDDDFYLSIYKNGIYDKFENKNIEKNSQNEPFFYRKNLLKLNFENIKRLLEDVNPNGTPKIKKQYDDFKNKFIYYEYNFKESDLKYNDFNLYLYSMYNKHKFKSSFIKNVIPSYFSAYLNNKSVNIEEFPDSLVDFFINKSLNRINKENSGTKDYLIINTLLEKKQIKEPMLKKLLGWENVFVYQNLNEDFIIDNYKNIFRDKKILLLKNQNLSENVLNTIKNEKEISEEDFYDALLSNEELLLNMDKNVFENHKNNIIKLFHNDKIPDYTLNSIFKKFMLINTMIENNLKIKKATPKEVNEYRSLFLVEKTEIIMPFNANNFDIGLV